MILFVPEVSPQMFTDPSYHLPAFYELWARWGPKEDRDFWAKSSGSEPGVLREDHESEDRTCADLREL